MKIWVTFAIAFFVCAGASAQTARKPCEELKAEIAKKLEARNVVSYSLEIVEKGKESEGKIVGSCDGGTKSIVYRKTAEASAAPAASPAKEAGKPQ